ncbi:MAG: ketol-acid reductoisomerase [Fimbriimonadales bacterium]
MKIPQVGILVFVAKIIEERDIDVSPILAKRVAVIGYGSQGRAHALNLRDSGIGVRVGLHTESESRTRAEADGFSVPPVADASEWADVIVLAVPDVRMPEVFASMSLRTIPHHAEVVREKDENSSRHGDNSSRQVENSSPHVENSFPQVENSSPHVENSSRHGFLAPPHALGPGQLLIFLHGFAYHFGFVNPPADIDVALVSPAGPGPVLRRLFEEGSGFASLHAVAQDATGNARALALAYARAVGCAKAGVIESTFKEETETDLFGEQAVLCGGLPELIKAGFDTLVEAGYQPEVAFFECMHQVKLITDLIYEGGLTWMRESISGTAEWGGFESGPRVISDESRKAMKAILNDVQTGKFAQSWMEEHLKGGAQLSARRREESDLLIETVGKEMRKRMPFIDDK